MSNLGKNAKIMVKIEKKFKNLIKNGNFDDFSFFSKENFDCLKSKEELLFDDYRICMAVHIPFCISKEKENKIIDSNIAQIENFVTKNKNKILYGFDLKGLTNLSPEGIKKILNYCGRMTKFMQTSSDFEFSVDMSFDILNENLIKVLKFSGVKRISFEYLGEDIKLVKEKLNLLKFYGIDKFNFNVKFDRVKRKNLFDLFYKLQKIKPTNITLCKLDNRKYYKIAYKNLVEMGYRGSFGQNYFSLNYFDLGMSSYERNTILNNISYKSFGKGMQSKSEKGVMINVEDSQNETCFLSSAQLFNDYLFKSGEINLLNLQAMEEILEENPIEKFNKEIAFLIKKKYIKIEENIIKITKKGLKYKNAIIMFFAL